jgi:hypothetical protein
MQMNQRILSVVTKQFAFAENTLVARPSQLMILSQFQVVATNPSDASSISLDDQALVNATAQILALQRYEVRDG